MENAIVFTFQIAILLFSVVIHEVSHGYAALFLGDRTALYAGRLTLNPIKHIDPFGSIILPAISLFLGGPLFGWAKPVPYNPYNLRARDWGPAIVGFAGPGSNLLLAVASGLLVRFSASAAEGSVFFSNLIMIASYVAVANLFLFIFNLIPIPPLDGSKVLFAVLPYQWQGVKAILERYGFFILLIFIFALAGLLVPIVSFVFRVIAGTGIL